MSKSQQYKIIEAAISAERMGGFNARFYDVRTSIIEINLFESLDKPYVTGNIAILDDKSLFEKIQLQGTELLRLTLAGLGNENNPNMNQREFYITGIEKKVKSNDAGKASVFVLNIIDKHMYLDAASQVSKSFSGRLDDEIIRICKTYLKKEVDLSYIFTSQNERSDAIQQNVKGIVPNLKPTEAIQFLQNRATTLTGSPFFVYASMHDENLRIANLDVMLQQKPFNKRLPYTFNPSNVNVAEGLSALEQSFIIKEIKTVKMGGTLNHLDMGVISSDYCNTNLNTGEITTTPFSIRQTLKNMIEKGVISPRKQNVFDEKFKIEDKDVDEYKTRNFHTITSSGTYGTFKGYSDEFEEGLFRKKLERIGILNHLYKNMFSVLITGTGFLVSKATVGDIVTINIVNDNIEDQRGGEEGNIDKNLSGDFLIYDTRHTFNQTSHTIALNVCKLESK